MVKVYKLHKAAGISAGLILLFLSISGFFLDHDKWSFLYTTTFSSVPSQTLKSEQRLFTSYHIDEQNSQHILVGSHRGLFESFNSGEKFSNISNLQILVILPFANELYLATSNGIYSYKNSHLKQIALDGEYITSLSVANETIVAVIDKETLVAIDKQTHDTLQTTIVKIDKKLLQEDIKLSRFVRDLHYGRGLFDGDISLLINDYATLILTFLALSGYIIWFLIKGKRHPKLVRKLIKTHANIFAILAIFPLIILAITGIFLDHSSGLGKFMKSVTISHSVLPPVYDTLESDIWSVDFDGKIYRIGNRYGIYKSKDLKSWSLESKGFAYKMIRRDDSLYVSGMGVPNRLFNNDTYTLLPQAPHMFRDVVYDKNTISYFSTMQTHLKIPHVEDISLYTLLLTIHDGTFFSSWWVWINDFAAIMLIVLSITGTIRWNTRKNRNNHQLKT